MKQTGQIFQMIRKSKRLTMTDVADGQISQSQISRFERGESSLTIDKFIQLLSNSAVALDEFESIYNNYSLSEELLFHKDLANAVDTENVAKVRSILKDWENKHSLEPQKRYIRINCIVIKTVLAQMVGFQMPKEEINYLKDYLMGVEDWGRFELWAFSNCVETFSDKLLSLLADSVISRTVYYESISVNNQLVIRTILNLISLFIQRKDFRLALKYINYLDHLHISIDFLYEKLMLKYNKGFYRYRMGDKVGLEIMRSCNEILGRLGCFEEENSHDRALETIAN